MYYISYTMCQEIQYEYHQYMNGTAELFVSFFNTVFIIDRMDF